MEDLRRMRAGVSVIELVIVMAIAPILLSLLFVAVQYAREAARRTVCANNLRQQSLAMSQFLEIHKEIPRRPDNEIGGWSVVILPYLEQEQLADELLQQPRLGALPISPLARRRPQIFSCPSRHDEDRGRAMLPIAHYALLSGKSGIPVTNSAFRILDTPVDSQIPWVLSPVLSMRSEYVGPHDGGFNIVRADGAVTLYHPR